MLELDEVDLVSLVAIAIGASCTLSSLYHVVQILQCVDQAVVMLVPQDFVVYHLISDLISQR